MKILAVLGLLVLIPLFVLGASLGATWVVVDVRADEGRFFVPVPLALVRTALLFAPAEARGITLDDPDLARVLPAAARAMEAIRDVPDFELVRVESPTEKVVVRKEGESLRIDVTEQGQEEVHVAVPFDFLDEVLEDAGDGRIETGVLVAALGSADGEILHVRETGGAEIRVRVW